MVDFGATATMMSDVIYCKIQSHKRPYLKTIEGRMQAGSGDDTNTLGTTEFTCTFSGRQFTRPAKVANINAEVVLGLVLCRNSDEISIFMTVTLAQGIMLLSVL